ncbi:MAG: hypothetical protein KUF77_15010 [Candidatus Thiodiazotropha sp. (ex Lucina aurantia)]|uniref:Uncharacterized protein n=2 Tax=Candidatus Thiodiazotropha TaxID=1913444 RepID=A0A7Z0VJA6_9GAMM|nr:hypothetical protein [Candidatus Thiodiazotropha endolucinida]MBT3012866.1 hypothetical protein [Candidatus Thiodiazotropha sp. (ex Lucina pensylvanica)]MBT3017293.1 hypothetical protein [Candidatus Thiodiazotropha taylori]MBT3040428.1 hypothetical protein [Candidatus Thiodiazotropha sp. (ex Codakia orbicularis)]MBV2104333.1 hypothetical protein [Candidatus Thiodiazotropha sp. (ex Lucina aurantia)]MCU7943086.1 hypothetical protein [Candidatus Thiodiazotropha sp. (ex Cardiolucina cf. quadrat
MNRSTQTRQRLAGVTLLGSLLFFSPVLTLFDKASEWAGIPISYLYLFGIWLALILLAAWTVEGRKH